MRRESARELENPLNLKQKRLFDITCEIYCFFSIKFLISRIQSMLGTVRPSRGIHRLNSKFVIFYRFESVSHVNIT